MLTPIMNDDDFHLHIHQHSKIEATSRLELVELGFTILDGPAIAGDRLTLSIAYDRAVSTAHPNDVSIRSSTRVHDFVNRGPAFDGIYLHPPLLAACCQLIGRPFRLSSMLARTLEPGAPIQPMHVDVRRHDPASPMVGFILMVDDFTVTNGATRFVPKSHQWGKSPASADEQHSHIATGQAGQMIIYNGSVWHGPGANCSQDRRRSIQGAFIPREATSATNWRSRMQADTLARINAVARYLLDV
jgi:hypothetical protein